ncbi:MAG: ribulose-phosphate 3-epimerase [Coxiellaceae bacterium]|nr:ribulose-phosphate 3-epimerase [Coxiellaceae bacterium]
MSQPCIIAASILSANFAHLGRESKAILKAGADEIHFDVMDHHFVPNLSFGSIVCEALRKDGITAPIDVHLMVTNPNDYIKPFAQAGASRLTFHANATDNIEKTIDLIHAENMDVGIAFNPDKPVTLSKTLLEKIEMILLMSVFAGFGGQQFIPESLEKIRETKKLIATCNPKILLGIDGGIKVDNIAKVVNAGANFVVMGSGLFNADDYSARMNTLRKAIS